MFSDIVRTTLEAGGWTPDRRVSVQPWVETLCEEGFTMHSRAVALLENFGGLVIEPPTLEGKVYRRCETIYFDPVRGASGDFDRVEYWEERLQTQLAPLGELSGAFTLLVAEDGRIFTYYHNELWQNGDSFEDALENNLIVANRKALEIGVIDEPLVFSDTVKTTLEAAGWTPERRVSVQPWVETLSEEGFTMHPRAVAVLENFGGLVIDPPKLENKFFGRAEDFHLDPVKGASGDFDRVEYWEKRLQTKLAPLGKRSEDILLMAEDGRILTCSCTELWQIAGSFEEALEFSLIVLRQNVSRIGTVEE